MAKGWQPIAATGSLLVLSVDNNPNNPFKLGNDDVCPVVTDLITAETFLRQDRFAERQRHSCCDAPLSNSPGRWIQV